MLAQDVRMWAQNIYWLIGLLIFGGFALAVVLALYIGIRMYLFNAGQKKSLEEYHRQTRRADGRMYPPSAVGKCDACGRICKKVYFVRSGELLCPECYEPFWRKTENWNDESAAPLVRLSAGDAMGDRQSRESNGAAKRS